MKKFTSWLRNVTSPASWFPLSLLECFFQAFWQENVKSSHCQPANPCPGQTQCEPTCFCSYWRIFSFHHSLLFSPPLFSLPHRKLSCRASATRCSFLNWSSKGLWEDPPVFWEQIWPSNSKQCASKPKTRFALASRPFAREIKEVLNYTAPLAKAWGTLYCQKRKPTLKAPSPETSLFVWAFPELSPFLVLKLQPEKISLPSAIFQ